MDRIDALPILERIMNHWGQRFSQGQHDHWMDTLCGVDGGIAGTAYVRLQRKSDRVPTPAEFLAECRTIQPYDASNREPPCLECADSGVITDTDHPRHWPGTPDTLPKVYEQDIADGRCNCNAVTWCRQCTHGQRAQQMMQRMKGTPT